MKESTFGSEWDWQETAGQNSPAKGEAIWDKDGNFAGFKPAKKTAPQRSSYPELTAVSTAVKHSVFCGDMLVLKFSINGAEAVFWDDLRPLYQSVVADTIGKAFPSPEEAYPVCLKKGIEWKGEVPSTTKEIEEISVPW